MMERGGTLRRGSWLTVDSGGAVGKSIPGTGHSMSEDPEVAASTGSPGQGAVWDSGSQQQVLLVRTELLPRAGWVASRASRGALGGSPKDFRCRALAPRLLLLS